MTGELPSICFGRPLLCSFFQSLLYFITISSFFFQIIASSAFFPFLRGDGNPPFSFGDQSIFLSLHFLFSAKIKDLSDT